MPTTPPGEAVGLTPKKMTDAVKNLPPLTVQDYVQRHFKGQLIRASGVVRSLDDYGARYATATFEDDGGVSVSANFTKPLGAEVKLISTGDKIGVVGQVFNVSARMVVLDECKLSEVKDTAPIYVAAQAVPDNKQWWTTWWGIVILGIVIAVVSGLLVWLITHHYDKPAHTSQEIAATSTVV